MAVPVIMRRRRQEVGGPNWTPLRLTSPGPWYSGETVAPQSASALTGWTDNSTNDYDLGTAVNTPDVTVCGPSFCGEFKRASTEYVHGSGFTITASTAGFMWAVYALRSGASTTNFHTLISIGNAASNTRFIELDIHNNGGALYPGLYWSSNTLTAFIRSGTAVSDTNFHSILVEGDTTGNTYRLWQDGTELTGGSVTTGTTGGGAVGNWLSDWTTNAPTRIGIGIGIRNLTNAAEPGDLKIFDCGFGFGTLGGDLSALLGHLARKRAVAT